MYPYSQYTVIYCIYCTDILYNMVKSVMNHILCIAGGGAASAGDGLVGGAVAGAAAGARQIHGDRTRDSLAHAGVQRPHDAPRGAAPLAPLAAAAPASARARRPVLHVTVTVNWPFSHSYARPLSLTSNHSFFCWFISLAVVGYISLLISLADSPP